MRIYLDSAPVIYLVEGVQPFADIVGSILAQPGTELIASDLTRLECRVKPLRDGDSALLAELDRAVGIAVRVIEDIRPSQ